jgi:hypothetical protein
MPEPASVILSSTQDAIAARHLGLAHAAEPRPGRQLRR